jgi:hypothetical protein
LRPFYVGELCAAHGWRGLFILRNIAAGLRTEAIAIDMNRHRAERFEQFLSLGAVGHQPAILDMSVGLFDQPLCRVPGSLGAPSSDALDAT